MQIVLNYYKNDLEFSVSHDDVRGSCERVEYEKRVTKLELKNGSRINVKQSSQEIADMVNLCYAQEQGRA